MGKMKGNKRGGGGDNESSSSSGGIKKSADTNGSVFGFAVKKSAAAHREDDSSDADADEDDVRSKASKASTANLLSLVGDLDVSTDGRLKISEAIENLAEKRASIRADALKSLIKILRSSNKALVDCVLDYSDTLRTSLCRLLRRPASEAEGMLCLQVLALYSLLIGSDENDMFESVEKVLIKIVTDEGGNEFRVRALATLAFASFICSSDSTDRVLTFCEDVLCEESEGAPVTSDMKARAILSWLVVASVAPAESILERSKLRVFEAVSELLDDGDSEVRIAAGMALATLWEYADAEAPGTEYTVSGMVLCENPGTVSQAVASLQRIAKDSSKRVSKRDRKEQRAALRDVADWIVNGEPPTGEVIRIQGAVLEMKTFAQMRLLEELREVLGDGLQSSLKVFPVLQDILDVTYLTEDMDGDGLDATVRKGGSVDKQRSNYRKQERKYRDVISAFGSDCCEGEDFSF